MSSVGFNIDGKPLEDIPEAINISGAFREQPARNGLDVLDGQRVQRAAGSQARREALDDAAGGQGVAVATVFSSWSTS